LQNYHTCFWCNRHWLDVVGIETCTYAEHTVSDDKTYFGQTQSSRTQCRTQNWWTYKRLSMVCSLLILHLLHPLYDQHPFVYESVIESGFSTFLHADDGIVNFPGIQFK